MADQGGRVAELLGDIEAATDLPVVAEPADGKGRTPEDHRPRPMRIRTVAIRAGVRSVRVGCSEEEP